MIEQFCELNKYHPISEHMRMRLNLSSMLKDIQTQFLQLVARNILGTCDTLLSLR